MVAPTGSAEWGYDQTRWVYCSPHSTPSPEDFALVRATRAVTFSTGKAGPPTIGGGRTAMDPALGVVGIFGECAPFARPDIRGWSTITVNYSIEPDTTTKELASAQSCLLFHHGSFSL
jgi:hypothetical protein